MANEASDEEIAEVLRRDIIAAGKDLVAFRAYLAREQKDTPFLRRTLAACDRMIAEQKKG